MLLLGEISTVESLGDGRYIAMFSLTYKDILSVFFVPFVKRHT